MHWETLNDYADAKDDIVREIERRIKRGRDMATDESIAETSIEQGPGSTW
jgi:hypothetical protein